MPHCPMCGYEVGEGDVHCSNCGFLLKEMPTRAGVSRACPSCGAQIDSETAYCSMCGQRIMLKRNCPSCCRENPVDAVFCEGCGWQLDREAESLAKPIPPPPPAPEPGLVSSIVESFVSLIKPMPPVDRPSTLVYEKLPSYTPIKQYFSFGVVLTLSGIILLFVSMVFGGRVPGLEFVGGIFAGFAAPLVYLFWIFRNDRFEREPLGLIALTFGWGAVSTFFVLLLQFIFPGLGQLFSAVPFIMAPLVEEPMKILGVFLLAKHPTLGKEFNGHLDGMVYGAAAGAGFAGVENILYIARAAPEVGFLQIALLRSVPGHLVYSGLVGRWLGLSKARKGRVQAIDLIPGLAVAMVLHGLWNLSNILILILSLILYAYAFFKLTKEAWRDEQLWGYSQGYAPIESGA